MSLTDISLSSICAQRTRQRLYNIPQIRMNLMSPYPTYTQHQLNMRRKVEILKYGNNTSSTKTNNPTKAQKWAQIASGRTQTKSYTTLTGYAPDGSGVYQQYIKKFGNNTCPNDDLIPTPTSSCDVPGPIMYLIRDETVPLYNYVSSINRSMSISQVEDNAEWNVYINNDNKSISAVESKLFSLYITSKVTQSSYSYNFQIPIGIYITGTDIAASSIGQNVLFTDNSLNIASVAISVYYNNEQVILKIPPSAYLSNGAVTYDLVNNPAPIISYDVSFTPVTANDTIMFFSYVGVLNVTDLLLYTEPGYIYDIMATFYVTNQFGNTTFTSTIQNYEYGVYTNLSPSNTYLAKNTGLMAGNPYPVPSQFPTFILSGGT
jgi:hypothetical protein